MPDKILPRGHRDHLMHIKLGRPGNFQAIPDLLVENGNDVLRRHFEMLFEMLVKGQKITQNESINQCV